MDSLEDDEGLGPRSLDSKLHARDKKRKKGEVNSDAGSSLVTNILLTLAWISLMLGLVLARHIFPFICAWRLHPNTRNQAKGMLEVLRLAM
jgi:hypothetical protein